MLMAFWDELFRSIILGRIWYSWQNLDSKQVTTGRLYITSNGVWVAGSNSGSTSNNLGNRGLYYSTDGKTLLKVI